MKRRSARPVVVEVKRTRTSSTSITAHAFGRSLPSRDLWKGLPLHDVAPSVAEKPEQQAKVVHQPAKAAEQTRRVLPAITPIFVLSEPEPREEPAGSDAPTTRSHRTGGERKRRASAVRPTAESVPATPAVSATDRIDAAQAPEPTPSTPTHLQQPRSNRREWTSRQPELRRGEGWKRRLPRACW
jgi:hypothetical protein